MRVVEPWRNGRARGIGKFNDRYSVHGAVWTSCIPPGADEQHEIGGEHFSAHQGVSASQIPRTYRTDSQSSGEKL
jgi:hypothetical protein